MRCSIGGWLLNNAMMPPLPEMPDAAMVDGAASLMTYFHGYRAGGKWPGRGRSVTGGGSQLTVKFSQYQVAAGGSTGKSFDRKACSLSIPVTVPAGYSVAVVAVDFAGYTNMARGLGAMLGFKLLLNFNLPFWIS